MTNQYDHMLATAIVDGLNMLPKRPRAWIAKHGGVYLPIVSEDPQKTKDLAREYKEMLKDAQSMVKPIDTSRAKNADSACAFRLPDGYSI